ncbi:hypothetical protein WMY93_032216 [Mugilogobius chulae]|uniref:Uncharacterized protein n=1 Tax=Mugilogobius chulae TaxID=88201 RepID=A0AAW0MG80_9GOBI
MTTDSGAYLVPYLISLWFICTFVCVLGAYLVPYLIRVYLVPYLISLWFICIFVCVLGAYLVPSVPRPVPDPLGPHRNPAVFPGAGSGTEDRRGSIGVWNYISPRLGGIGFASCVVCFFVALYYNVIIGWSLFYFSQSFQQPLPWHECPLIKNKTSTYVVPECEKSSATTYYWYRQALDISDSISEGGGLNWRMTLCLLAAWTMVCLAMIKGIQSSGKREEREERERRQRNGEKKEKEKREKEREQEEREKERARGERREEREIERERERRGEKEREERERRRQEREERERENREGKREREEEREREREREKEDKEIERRKRRERKRARGERERERARGEREEKKERWKKEGKKERRKKERKKERKDRPQFGASSSFESCFIPLCICRLPLSSRHTFPNRSQARKSGSYRGDESGPPTTLARWEVLVQTGFRPDSSWTTLLCRSSKAKRPRSTKRERTTGTRRIVESGRFPVGLVTFGPVASVVEEREREREREKEREREERERERERERGTHTHSGRGGASCCLVMYFSSLFPYVVLICFLVRALLLKGSVDGIKHMFTPKIDIMLDPKVWREAATQVFFALGLGFGGVIAFSSYNKRDNNCHFDAVLVSFINFFTSVLATLVVFAVLGFKANIMNDKCVAANTNRLVSLLGSSIERSLIPHHINLSAPETVTAEDYQQIISVIMSFFQDLRDMLGFTPYRFYFYMWKFITPILLLVLLVSSFIQLIMTPPGYSAWIEEQAAEQKLRFPVWGIVVCVSLVVMAILPVPVVFLLRFCRIIEDGPGGLSSVSYQKGRMIAETPQTEDADDTSLIHGKESSPLPGLYRKPELPPSDAAQNGRCGVGYVLNEMPNMPESDL